MNSLILLYNKSMKNIIAIFVVASIVGFIGESIFVFITTDHFKASGNMGMYYQLYGFCAVGLYLIFKNFKLSFLITLLTLTFAVGAIEFVANYFLTDIMLLPSWNYTDEILDLYGRTSLPRALGIAFIATLFYMYAVPLIIKFTDDKFFTFTSYFLFTYIIIDTLRQILILI